MAIFNELTTFYGRLVFIEEAHLPHTHVSLEEDRTFHHSIPSKLYRNCKFNFVVNFDLILSTSKRSCDVQGFFNQL